MLGENAMNGVALIGDSGVGLPEKVVDPEAASLMIEIRLVNGAQEKDGQIPGLAIFKNLTGAWEQGNRVVEFPENLSENLLQLLDRGLGDVLLIKSLVRKVEPFTEGLAVQGSFTMGGKDPVGGFQHGGKVVHERAGPVEDDITNHKLRDFRERQRIP